MAIQNKFVQFEQRKLDHIQFALDPANQAVLLNHLDSVHLLHDALPDLDFVDITLTNMRFGKLVSTPFFVSSMTAGHQDAVRINQHLITACHQTGWAMGVGSQRRELQDPHAMHAWKQIRKTYPSVVLFSNIGITQLIATPMQAIQTLIDNIQADALIIHCNALQEVIQPEGMPAFKGCWDAIDKAVKFLKVPVIIKETGCGFAAQTLRRLNNLGVAAIDLSGLGGTHWGRIEGCRNPSGSIAQQAAQTFKNWGITTLQSMYNANASTLDCEIWGSGGVRHGLDAAKLLALGASSIGCAQPLLKAALTNVDTVVACMQQFEYELKIALFCTGSASIYDLRGKTCP